MDQNYQSYSETSVEELPPAPKKKGPNIILIVVVVLILLCCLCLLFAVFMYYIGGDWLTDQLGITQWLAPALFPA